jgi:hypothetical protein
MAVTVQGDRMRNIAPEIFSDEFFGTLPMAQRVLWIGLLTNIADDQGRMLDNPALIRSLIFPYDADVTVAMIEKALTIFVKKHKILRYHAGLNGDGRQLIQIVNWWRYQKSAQWAQKSNYPPPAKWSDRIRIHVSGGGNQPYTLNWDSAGGFIASTKGLRSGFKGYIPIPIPIPIPKIKIKPTNQPPGESKSKMAGGGGQDESALDTLTTSQRKIADKLKPVLLSAGLGEKKFETFLYKVATRLNLKSIPLVLAALASSYADPKANNKVLVAVYRIQHDCVPPEYMDPSKWSLIPKPVLKSAGIDDLETYRLSNAGKNNKLAALRSRSRDDKD